jgi:hypothetical protein
LLLWDIKNWCPKFRFLDKLCDFFKPEQIGGFNDILLTDLLSNVTCRTLLAFSDLLVYPSQTAMSNIKVKNKNINTSKKKNCFRCKVIASTIARTLLTSVSDSLQQVKCLMEYFIIDFLVFEGDYCNKRRQWPIVNHWTWSINKEQCLLLFISWSFE